jgi:prepilin-type N-terminal cleavage/methylation domain-containing protein/prepilin-type processing-associated H-X9-DG protein
MQKKAFTLAELLVVMLLIAVVMGLLMPALARARQQGRSVLCLSNLRQMVIAAEVYAQMHDDYYPIAQYRGRTSSARFEHCWDFTTIEDATTHEVKVVPGLLWQGQTIERIQQCPSFKGNSNTRCDPYTGYNYNTSYIGHGQGERIEIPARINQVERPANCAIFGDGEYWAGANKFMRAPWKSEDDTFSYRAAGTQGYRHLGKTNVVWCDGSAYSVGYRFTETYQPEKKKIVLGTGFLSPDNSAYDLK